MTAKIFGDNGNPVASEELRGYCACFVRAWNTRQRCSFRRYEKGTHPACFAPSANDACKCARRHVCQIEL